MLISCSQNNRDKVERYFVLTVFKMEDIVDKTLLKLYSSVLLKEPSGAVVPCRYLWHNVERSVAE